MRSFNHTLILGALILCLLSSCGTIHQFPDENAVDPTAINTIEVELQIRAKDIIERDVTDGVNQSIQSDQTLRIIVEVYKLDNLRECLERKEILTNQSNPEAVSSKVTFLLASTQYRFMVWGDYVNTQQPGDQYYATTSNLRSIKIIEPMMTNSDHLDCFSGTYDLDLAPYRDKWDFSLPISITLERPIAKYMLITTDVEKFISQMQANSNAPSLSTLSQYRVKVIYSGYMINGFDTNSNEPNDAQEGFEYFATFQLLNTKEALIGFDYQFLNGHESSIPVSLQIFDEKGVVINEVNDVIVPLTRGDISIVKSDFLTRDYTPGIGIDPGFEGEIKINIPD